MDKHIIKLMFFICLSRLRLCSFLLGVTHLHTGTHSWLQQHPVLQCWDTARRTTGPPCPGRSQRDTGRTAPAPHCSTCLQHSSLTGRKLRWACFAYFMLVPITLSENKRSRVFPKGSRGCCKDKDEKCKKLIEQTVKSGFDPTSAVREVQSLLMLNRANSSEVN